MIKEFDKQNLKNLRTDVDAALAAVGSKYGIAIRLGSIRYDAAKATSKIEFAVTTAPDGSSTVNPREAVMAADFKSYAKSFGLKPEHYGVTFQYGRQTYKLVGLKPRAPKMPILATNVATGQTFKLPESSIASLQSAEYKEMYSTAVEPFLPGVSGQTCSNESAFDAKFRPIGKCKRPATTSRKTGFGRAGRVQPFCAECAQLMDESRHEMEAEARMS